MEILAGKTPSTVDPFPDLLPTRDLALGKLAACRWLGFETATGARFILNVLRDFFSHIGHHTTIRGNSGQSCRQATRIMMRVNKAKRKEKRQATLRQIENSASGVIGACPAQTLERLLDKRVVLRGAFEQI
jgi:hypothetical protein